MKAVNRIRDRWECRKVGALMQSHLDGVLPPDVTRRLHAHLEACRRCGLEADTYRALIEAVGGLTPAADPEAVQRLKQFVDQLEQPPAP